jgi:hypothetical protein
MLEVNRCGHILHAFYLYYSILKYICQTDKLTYFV